MTDLERARLDYRRDLITEVDQELTAQGIRDGRIIVDAIHARLDEKLSTLTEVEICVGDEPEPGIKLAVRTGEEPALTWADIPVLIALCLLVATLVGAVAWAGWMISGLVLR